MTNNSQNLGEQALDKVIEIAISSQLDEVEQVEVNIHTDPGKIIQGQVDSASFMGEGLVMKRDLRIAGIEVHTGSMAINPLKAVVGEVELTQPAHANTHILLTEEDINHALASDYLQSKMKNLEVRAKEETITVDFQHITLRLLENNEMAFDGSIMLNSTREIKQFSAIVKPSLKNNGHRIELEIISAQGKGLELEFVTALFEKIIELLDFRNFELEGMSLQLKDLDIQRGKLLIRATTRLEQLPTE